MKCDINREGGLVIKCASVAEEEGMLAWLDSATKRNIHIGDGTGQVRKMSMIDADRIHIRLDAE